MKLTNHLKSLTAASLLTTILLAPHTNAGLVESGTTSTTYNNQTTWNIGDTINGSATLSNSYDKNNTYHTFLARTPQTGTLNINTSSKLTSQYVYNGYLGNGTVNLALGGILKGSHTTYNGYSVGTTGTLNITDANSQLQGIYLKNGYAGTGITNVSNGGAVGLNTNDGRTYNGETVTGHGTLIIQGVNANGDRSKITGKELFNGVQGTGITKILDGAIIDYGTHGYIHNGQLVGSNGSLLIDGINATTGDRSEYKGKYLFTGVAGTGSTEIKNGAYAYTAHRTIIGYQSTGVGTLLIDGVNNGTASQLYANQIFDIGNDRGSLGTATVSNGAKLHVQGYMRTGYFGTGTLNILSGANVESTSTFYIADQGGSKGTVNIDGPNTNLKAYQLRNGERGDATINISNGATVEITQDIYTSLSSYSNTLTNISGTGTTITAAKLLNGHDGASTLNVSDGAQITINYDYFNGYRGNAVGITNLSGQNTKITTNNAYNANGGSTGTLTFSDGAQIIANNYFYQGNKGSINLTLSDEYVTDWAITGNESATATADKGSNSVNLDGILAALGDDTVKSNTTYKLMQIKGENPNQNRANKFDYLTNSGDIVGKVGGRYVYIDYYGGDGNDITLTTSHAIDTDNLGYNDITNTAGTIVPPETAGEIHYGHNTNKTGQLLLNNGSTLNNTADVHLGYNTTTTGLFTASGTGSTWAITGNQTVGNQGTGVLKIENGANVSANSSNIGLATNSSGAVTVDGTDAEWALTTNLNIGGSSTTAGGTGTLEIKNEGKVTATTTNIWDDGSINQSSGTFHTYSLNLDGGANITHTNGLFLVTNGYAAPYNNLNDTYIGYFGTTVANVTNSSTWTTANTLRVGHCSTGTLNIASNSIVSSNLTIIGGVNNHIGTVNITGTGSSLNSTGILVISRAGNGNLNITNGASATSGSTTFVGQYTNSVSQLTLKTQGSLNTLNLYSGGYSLISSGTATINIEDDSTIDISNDLILWDTSTLNIELDDSTIFDSITNQFSYFDVEGNATVDGVLNITLDNAFNTLAVNDEFILVDVLGTQSGQFDTYAEGDIVYTDGSSIDLKISYVGGDGNDIVLTAHTYVTPIPEPTSIALLTLAAVATLKRKSA